MRRFSRALVPLIVAAVSGGTVDVPERPFSGSFGATAGAGAVAGDEIHGADNPATPAIGRPAWSLSGAGYAPFGIEDLHVAEVDVVRTGGRWGAGLGMRALFDAAGPDASRWTARLARQLPAGLHAGASLRGSLAEGRFSAPEPGAGLLCEVHPALSLGAHGVFGPGGLPRRAALGADAGGSFAPGYRLRVSVEHERRFGAAGRGSAGAGTDWRFGARLRLHPALSAHAGYATQARTAALGLRFGFGGWDVFSALRRHATLGPTAVQGVLWTRTDRDPGRNPGRDSNRDRDTDYGTDRRADRRAIP